MVIGNEDLKAEVVLARSECAAAEARVPEACLTADWRNARRAARLDPVQALSGR